MIFPPHRGNLFLSTGYWDGGRAVLGSLKSVIIDN